MNKATTNLQRDLDLHLGKAMRLAMTMRSEGDGREFGELLLDAVNEVRFEKVH